MDRADIMVYDKNGDECSLDAFLSGCQHAPLVVNMPDNNYCGATNPFTVNNALLAYVVFAMQSGTAEKNQDCYYVALCAG
jgi:hypothetical protein